MTRKTGIGLLIVSFYFLSSILIHPVIAQEREEIGSLDDKVKKFLKSHRGQWVDLNVPEADGRVLYDIIIKNNYTKALEIGTSTGHSAIWMAWALSKTGGKLITIEIDEGRYQEALSNFKEAGVSDVVDARLADAHDLVKKLKGPFDFVFCDADKGWYKNYFKALAPKLEVGGSFTAHNVSRSWGGVIREFLDYVKSLPHFETTINRASSEGISISYKNTER